MMPATTPARSVSLRGLLEDLTADAVPELMLQDLSQSAQDILPGGLFLATAGASHHGLDFIDQAITRGAVAVAWEPLPGVAPPNMSKELVGVAVPDLRQHAGLIADRFFGEPSAAMQIAGVTGTNGKTSTTFFVAQAVEKLGPDCAVMGTLGNGRPGALQSSVMTTPDAVSLHRSLAGMLEQGVRHVAMEVSSHALVQGRVNAVRFNCAAFTNLSRDHLDYHGDMDAYGAAKLDLFTRHAPAIAVLNASDPWGREIARRLPDKTRQIIVEPQDPQEVKGEWLAAIDVDAHEQGLTFQVASSHGAARLHSRLVGDFNATNLLVALGILLAWGFSFRRAVAALEEVRAPAGRMETFKGSDGPMAIVDYAHSPDALEKVLRAARAHATGKLSVVFGCGGERDVGKRPQMGEIATRLADEVYVTDDNPRGEDPDEIVAGILAGSNRPVTVERDRAAAIAMAIAAAAAGDVVVIAGKGHENYQTTGSGRQPFSDREVVSGLLAIDMARDAGAPA